MSRLGKSELSYGEYLPVREVLARLDAVDEDAGARGRRRAVRPGDLPGRRRARTASPTSTGSDRPCADAARRCHGAARRAGAFAVAVLVSLAVLFAPGSDVPSAPAGRGQARARLAVRRAGADRAVGRDRRGACSAPLLVLYAGGQRGDAGADGRWTHAVGGDWLADVVGVLLGLLLWDVLAAAPAAR